MKKVIISCLVFLFFSSLQAQKLEPYKIFNQKGKSSSYSKLVKSAKTADVLFFGELHNNAIAHWLQYEITIEMLQERELILGAEMFEADNQEPLTNYVNGSIDESGLDSTARLWKNYDTDYKPLVEIAKANQLAFIATNIPRRYASMVYRGGFEALDTLPENEKEWIAPLPIVYDPEVACYKNILAMSHGHGGENLPKAQAIKDATMSHFMESNMVDDHLFIHYNGSYHSDSHEGIAWYLSRSKPELKIVTITVVSQSDIDKLNEENLGLADFIIVVDENMTNTY